MHCYEDQRFSDENDMRNGIRFQDTRFVRCQFVNCYAFASVVVATAQSGDHRRHRVILQYYKVMQYGWGVRMTAYNPALMKSAQFISEPITPEPGSFDPQAMSFGLAGLPGAFEWRGERYVVVECLDHRKVSTPEQTGERYLRRQEFTVMLESGQTAVIYIERQSRPGVSREAAKKRWYLYTITQA